jgi:hypothetical protein
MRFNRSASILLMFISCCTLNTVNAQSVDAPVFTPGGHWDYQNYDLWSNRLTSRLATKVVGVSGDFVRMQYETTNVGDKGELMKPTVTEATIRSELNAYTMFRGERMEKVFYKWPLEPGKKWTYQYKNDLPPTGTATTPQTMTTNVNAEVVGWETIEVPAGKFKVLKIIYKANTITENPFSTAASTSMQWYSPDVKGEVQSSFEAIGADGMPQARTMRQLVQYKPDNK